MEALARFGESAGRAGDLVREHREREVRTRLVERFPQDRCVAIGASGSQPYDAVIRDVSTYGCRLESQPGWLRTGAFISIRPDANSAVTGIVRWVRADAAGIEFLQPLHPGDSAWHALLEGD